jgi:hypothetical protein
MQHSSCLRLINVSRHCPIPQVHAVSVVPDMLSHDTALLNANSWPSCKLQACLCSMYNPSYQNVTTCNKCDETSNSRDPSNAGPLPKTSLQRQAASKLWNSKCRQQRARHAWRHTAVPCDTQPCDRSPKNTRLGRFCHMQVPAIHRHVI